MLSLTCNLHVGRWSLVVVRSWLVVGGCECRIYMFIRVSFAELDFFHGLQGFFRKSEVGAFIKDERNHGTVLLL